MLDYIRTQSRRILNAFFYSLSGLRATFGSEPSVQQWSIVVLVALPLGLWLGDSGAERALLIGSVMMIVIIEMVNTAIETVVDRISEDQHPLSKKAKDIGSAMVLMTFLMAVLIWVLILFG